MELVVATSNEGKLREFKRILSPLGIDVLSPKEVGGKLLEEETGTTFSENSYLKAKFLYDQIKKPVIADDSGLSIDCLDGRPGVYSARYGGEDLSYPEKIAMLLKEMEGTNDRGAQFEAAICCILSDETIIECHEICRGEIGFEIKGKHGFGYDPVFMVDGRSFGEFSDEEKDRYSHRGKALRVLVEKLEAYLDNKGENQ